TPGPYQPLISVTADDWVEQCSRRTRAEPVSVRLDTGRTWLLGFGIFTRFLTSTPPNSLVPDCGVNAGQGVLAARSQHPGGVHALMADGSARFFKDGIDARTWRALGTRRGGELISIGD